MHISVDRAELVEQRSELGIKEDDLRRDYRFFDRVQGMCWHGQEIFVVS